MNEEKERTMQIGAACMLCIGFGMIIGVIFI